MPEIKSGYLLMFAAFVLPGAISMYVYAMLVPQKDARLQEQVLEAICFSLLNLTLLFPLLDVLIIDGAVLTNIWLIWLAGLVALVLAPTIWPFLLVRLLRVAEHRGWIAVRARTAWDEFFGTRDLGCFVAVTLNDGSIVGGRFGERSYASAYPDPGHIFIEEQWLLNEDRTFREKIAGTWGVILRPSDYKYVQVYLGDDPKVSEG